MKKVYNEIKTWACTNPDGSEVIVTEGDEILVHFDLTRKEVTEEFLNEHPDHLVKLRILKLTSRHMDTEMIGKPCHCLLLYPKNIIEIKKL